MISKSRPTLLAEYLADVYAANRPKLRDSSIEQYEIAVDLFSRWLGRPALLLDLTRESLLAFARDYYRLGLAATTVNNKRGVLLRLWHDAVDTGARTDSPPRIKRLPESHRLPEAWTVDEISKLLAIASRLSGSIAGLPASYYWRSLFLACYDTGGRIGALGKVRREEVRLDGPSPGLVLLSDQSKTWQAKWCPLHPQTIEECKRIWLPERELMWPWPKLPAARRERLHTIYRRAGVRYGRNKGGCFHKFRRTSGSLVEANGGDGARHLGNTRSVFQKYYLDPRIGGQGQLGFLPRPRLD